MPIKQGQRLPTIKVGQMLPNGATVLALRPEKDGNVVVLADWPRNSEREFITWVLTKRGVVLVKRYFMSYEIAKQDFQTR